jgi:glycosyltransferase involved in cell wall biosynthesis
MSGIVHPCKIYGALSIGRPALCLGPKDSYLGDITGEDEVGWSIRQGDVDSAVAALKKAVDQTHKERAAMGLRAQQVATEKFGHEQLVEQFLKTVLKTADDC